MTRMLVGDQELEVALEDVQGRINRAQEQGPTIRGIRVMPSGWITVRAKNTDAELFILEWHPFDGLVMALVAWTRKDVRYATNETAVSAGVPGRGRAAGAGRPVRQRRSGELGVQRAVAA